MSDEKVRLSGESDRSRMEKDEMVLPTVNPTVAAQQEKKKLHPAFYIAAWIGLSGSVILYNKWVLARKQFTFPIFLTTWHLIFATIMTQSMARFTTLLDSRKKVPMTGRVYLRAIVPIGVFFSLSLIFNNAAYLSLSVSFIQMLKATTPVMVLIVSWSLGITPPNFKTLGNVSIIVLGVIVASIGEVQFELIGFLFQIAGILCEATRLAMVERLLSGGEFKMDPLVSLYYFAPVCATMNFIIWIFMEMPKMTMDDVTNLGSFVLLSNASVAFALNVAVVCLIGRTSSLVLTLSGVVKDILLVVASMVLFLDPVSPLQAFGYSIALCGLMYYKLGNDKMKGYIAERQRGLVEYGARHPATRKSVLLATGLLTMFILLGGLAPNIAKQQLNNGSSKLAALFADSK